MTFEYQQQLSYNLGTIREALGKAKMLDPRFSKPDTAMVSAWAQALTAEKREWNRADVLQAVTRWYASNSNPDAHLTAGVLISETKAIVRDRIARERREERELRERARDQKNGLVQQKELEAPPLPSLYDDAHLAVVCDQCGAGVGAKCTNPRTGAERKTPCLARIRAVKRAEGDPNRDS